ncbi:uncharacterized protein LOC134725228 [Mytilus trossulus]|uniref:uncharacterized protein LOC134725228 n=1 Tax=Mytilus trossulus TaxID=6551 RepID=UPI003004974C
MYDCTFKCSSYVGANYIVYFKMVCQCIMNLDEELDTTYNYCVNKCSSFYDLYCQGDIGVLVFAIERNHTAQTEEIDILSKHKVYNMSSSTCLVIAKGVYTTEQMVYCRRKLMDFYCDGNIISIIFRLNIKYLQWICKRFQDPLAKPYFRVISRIDNKISTTAFNKPDSSIYMNTSTTTPVLADVPTPNNYTIIICNCILFLLVLLVWIILYLKHFRPGKQDTTLKKQASSTRQEQTSSTSQSPRTSNYEQISEVSISRPFRITNETYSDTCIPE